MKVTKREEKDFGEIPDEDQLTIIKDELVEFAGRVVAAVGLGLAGVWYGSSTSPHTFVTEAGSTMQVTTNDIVLYTVGILAVSAFVGYSAYKRRNRILDAVRAIQNNGKNARDSEC